MFLGNFQRCTKYGNISDGNLMDFRTFYLLELVWYKENANIQKYVHYPLAAEAEIPNSVLK